MTNPMKCKCGQMPIKRDVYRNQKIDTQFRCDSCGISGPYKDPDHVGWDGLMGGSAAPKEGTVRKVTSIIPVNAPAVSAWRIFDDGSCDHIVWLPVQREWSVLACPTPAEVKGDVS